MATNDNAAAPAGATDAVLKPSDPVPEGSREVRGLEFNEYASRSITVEELVGGYASMGFQATSVAEAVRIINDMVSLFSPMCAALASSGCGEREREPSGNIRAPWIVKQFSRI
jgi:deoxyhypusine synthase